MQNIVLTSTLHDPRGALLDDLDKAASVVLKSYKSWVVSITQGTDKKVEEKLRQLGAHVVKEDKEHPVIPINKEKDPYGVENNHLTAMQEALKLADDIDAKAIQYTDGDRIIMAANYYPDDLAEMARLGDTLTGEKLSYVNFRRSGEDYLTHPFSLMMTELQFSRLYSEAFGVVLDVASTAHAMSKDIVREIMKRSEGMEAVPFPEPKWLIIARKMGAEIKPVETRNVLRFETPEEFRKETNEAIREGAILKLHEKLQTVVSRQGRETTVERDHEAEISPLKVEDLDRNYDLRSQAYMATLGMNGPRAAASPAEVGLRFSNLFDYLRVLQAELPSIVQDGEKRELVKSDIEETVHKAEIHRQILLEVLGTGPKDVEGIRSIVNRGYQEHPFQRRTKER